MLTQQQISEVKGYLALGHKQHDIAAKYGVNGGRIAEVSKGKVGASIKPAPASALPPLKAQARFFTPSQSPSEQIAILDDLTKNYSEATRKLIGEKVSKKLQGRPSGKKGISNPKHSEWMKQNNPMKGKTHTDEVKDLLRKINSKPKSDEHKSKISKNSPNNKFCIIEGIRYISVAEAARQLNLSENTVRGRVKNKNFKNWNYEK